MVVAPDPSEDVYGRASGPRRRPVSRATMRILVTGKEGQVVRSLAAITDDNLSVTALGRPDLDITDLDSIARAIEFARPDILVNPAAYTGVDRAESEAQVAFAVNREGARNAAVAAAAAGLPIIHV